MDIDLRVGDNFTVGGNSTPLLVVGIHEDDDTTHVYYIIEGKPVTPFVMRFPNENVKVAERLREWVD